MKRVSQSTESSSGRGEALKAGHKNEFLFAYINRELLTVCIFCFTLLTKHRVQLYQGDCVLVCVCLCVVCSTTCLLISIKLGGKLGCEPRKK